VLQQGVHVLVGDDGGGGRDEQDGADADPAGDRVGPPFTRQRF
jgi:hypothetical protein